MYLSEYCYEKVKPLEEKWEYELLLFRESKQIETDRERGREGRCEDETWKTIAHSEMDVFNFNLANIHFHLMFALCFVSQGDTLQQRNSFPILDLRVVIISFIDHIKSTRVFII